MSYLSTLLVALLGGLIGAIISPLLSNVIAEKREMQDEWRDREKQANRLEEIYEEMDGVVDDNLQAVRILSEEGGGAAINVHWWEYYQDEFRDLEERDSPRMITSRFFQACREIVSIQRELQEHRERNRTPTTMIGTLDEKSLVQRRDELLQVARSAGRTLYNERWEEWSSADDLRIEKPSWPKASSSVLLSP